MPFHQQLFPKVLQLPTIIDAISWRRGMARSSLSKVTDKACPISNLRA